MDVVSRVLSLTAVGRPNRSSGTVLIHQEDANKLERFLPRTRVWVFPPGQPNRRAALMADVDRGTVLKGAGVIVLSAADQAELGLGQSSTVHVQSARPFQPSVVAVVRIDTPAEPRPKRSEPERLVILFDNSGSMAGPALEQAKGALRTLIFEKVRNPVRNAQGLIDEIGLIRFGNDTEVVFPPDSDYESHLGQIFALTAGGGTPMEEALRLLPPLYEDWEGSHRRALMITDGGASVSEGCVQQLVDGGIEVISVAIGSPGAGVLQTLANATGGQVVSVENLAELDAVLFTLA